LIEFTGNAREVIAREVIAREVSSGSTVRVVRIPLITA